MKITALETLRTQEFANVLWVRVLTDSGVIGLGETFYGAGAVEAVRVRPSDALRPGGHSQIGSRGVKGSRGVQHDNRSKSPDGSPRPRPRISDARD